MRKRGVCASSDPDRPRILLHKQPPPPRQRDLERHRGEVEPPVPRPSRPVATLGCFLVETVHYTCTVLCYVQHSAVWEASTTGRKGGGPDGDGEDN